MNKVTVSLPQGDWGSIKTKYPKNSDKVTFTDFTGTSKNFDTEISGVITKRKGGVNYNPTLLTNPAADLYEAIFSSGTHHLLTVDGGTLKYSAGGGITNTVTAGYSSNGNFEFALYQNRVYFGNGIDNSQSYDTTTNYGGVSYTAPQTKAAGCQVPTAPTAALVTDSTTGQVPAGGHTYKVTYLYYGAQESNGSTASSLVTTDATHTQVTVTIPVGGYGVTARKIYRDNNDGNWALITTVSDNTTTSYADKLPSTLGIVIPTDNGLPPTFSKIVQKLDRLWVAGVSSSTSTLYYSAAGFPDIFNSTGYLTCNPKDPIVGLAVYNDQVMVLNRNSFGFIIGSDSSSFAYSEVPSTVGCVDNRSIQLRASRGIPTIMWLSDKGFYEWNGSSLTYLSDPIEDQVNLNIQQAAQVKGKNVQDTQSDFSAGTSTPGIVLTSGGFITQNNPKKVYQTEADFVSGTSTNVALLSTGNTLQVPLAKTFDLASGSFNNSVQSGSNIILSTISSFTGESANNGGTASTACQAFATPIIPTVTGTLTSLSMGWSAVDPTSTVTVWTDAGGFPGSVVASTSVANSGIAGPPGVSVISITASLTGGTKYWVGVTGGRPVTMTYGLTGGGSTIMQFSGGYGVKQISGVWSTGFTVSGSPNVSLCPLYAYAFTPAPIPSSGTWISATYDSQSTTVSSPITLVQAGSYPANTSGITYLEGSTDGSTWDISDANTNFNGTAAQAISSRRYWRVRCLLSTTDNRSTPSLGIPSITFGTTATWVSPAIDHTTDITALNALTVVSSVPAGTSVTTTIATSTDNISYSSFTAIGSAVAHRYSKIQVVLTSDVNDLTTASVSNIQLTWTVVSNQTSSAIDTSNVPVGWELFQSSYGTGGTVTFQVRTATSSGGLSGAGYVTVTNGAYIPATVNRFIQWKATLTSTADSIASVDNVTINWFIQLVNSIRAASLFFGRSYYLSAAEFGQTKNNIIFKIDEQNKWRIYRDINVGTMSLFFNQPYYGSSTSGQLVKWLSDPTDQGTAITLDVQTAAINYGDLEHNKILRKVRVIGKNTGATYTPQYSTDNGLTWKSMVNVLTGLTTFTTTSDGGLFDVRVQPVFASDNATGITHVFRLINSDSNLCEVHSIKFEAWIRKGEI